MKNLPTLLMVVFVAIATTACIYCQKETKTENSNLPPPGGILAFYSERDGHYEIYGMNSDGSDQKRLS
jgi:hypothetical protein